MTNFSYDDTVPTTGANPSNQYTLMTQNFASIKGIIAVDHISLSANNGGQHLQVTLNGNQTPAAPTGANSVLYTSVGVASTASLLNFVNPNATYPINLIRAYGLFPGNGALGVTAALGNQAVNISSVTHSATGFFSVVLTANSVTGLNFGVMCTTTFNSAPPPGQATISVTYVLTGIGTFALLFKNPTTGALIDVDSFTFTVMQL